MAERNGQTSGDKAVYLIICANKLAAHILYSVPTGANYEEVAAMLENRYGVHHLMEAFSAELSKGVYHDGNTMQEFTAAIDRLAVPCRFNRKSRQ
jgi:hypothetical protein